ncbi:MAG TPA: MBL fold metallo-hydrolase [candidate division Zixibacteria bacterium]|nr:MBL fold metallo-hydrolase [candidate division Zixibacteria bacterium]
MARITFHGAARTVTGSKYLVEADGESVLIDCGMFQGEKRLRLLNWEKPAFDAGGVQRIVLTHAHIDHIGYLPRLVNYGFRGRVFATPATRELAKIMLEDAAEIHMEDARYLRKHKLSKHEEPLPFFDSEAAAKAWRKVISVPRQRWQKISRTFSFRYHTAGHLLGAASVELKISEGGAETTVLFSGDIGRYGLPFVRDPEPALECDYLVMESTYGNRSHEAVDVSEALSRVVNRAVEKKGILLIPSFAVGRCQQLVYMLRRLILAGRIPSLPVHVDSPMALDATKIYCKYEHDHGIPLDQLEGPDCVLDGPNVHFVRSREESIKLNELKGPAIIISSSGMLTGGRVLHHLVRLAPDPTNIILFAGYQAAGTRGRAMLEGAPTVRVFRADLPVRAETLDLDGMSGHGDAGELLRWSSTICRAPRMTFLTHGEYESAQALGELIRQRRDWPISIPDLGDSAELK